MQPLEKSQRQPNRIYIYILVRLTKLDQQTNGHADDDCPLSGIEIVVAYVLDLFVG